MSPLDRRPSLSRNYYRRVRNAFIVAGGIHVAAFLAAPPYLPSPPVMRPDPIRLLPAAHGWGGATIEPIPVASSAVSARAGAGNPRASVLAGVLQSASGREGEVRSEQWAPPAAQGTGEGDAGVVAGGAGEESPPTYYGYDTPPRAVRTFEPDYPSMARASGFEGTVVINVNLDEHGGIIRAWVASASAPETLIASALEAVYRFDFSPGLLRGVPVRSTVAIPFRFYLNKTS
ncbi:MAG TPA: energy transducer TonB [Candidatus Eisenbacteria bacterium]|nr:energy transducer TonB [Candidatus Eisenbacteria bacterium]